MKLILKKMSFWFAVIVAMQSFVFVAEAAKLYMLP